MIYIDSQPSGTWSINFQAHHRLDGLEFEQAPGGGDGQGGLACCGPGGRRESDTTERLNTATKTCSSRFPGPQSASLPTLNSFLGCWQSAAAAARGSVSPEADSRCPSCFHSVAGKRQFAADVAVHCGQGQSHLNLLIPACWRENRKHFYFWKKKKKEEVWDLGFMR